MLEVAAVIFTLLSVWLIRKQNIWCWITGMIGTVCYYFIFKEDHAWGNMMLQFVFLIQSVYGWITWGRNDELSVRQSSPKTIAFEVLIGLAISALIYGISVYVKVPLTTLDILTTGLSIVGMFLIATKMLEAWLFWGVINILYIILFLTTGHILSTLLYVVFFINSYLGYKEWKNSIEVLMF